MTTTTSSGVVVAQPTPAAGILRDPTGTLRRVMCRACGEFWWTQAKRFNGRCGPCRVKGRMARFHPVVESVCVDCRAEIDGRAKRKRCGPCKAERNRRNTMRCYYARTSRAKVAK